MKHGGELATSPLTAATDSKTNDLPLDPAQQYLGDKAYKSATDFGAVNQAAVNSKLNPSNSKGLLSNGGRVPSMGRTTAASTRPLPSINHSKQIDKLQRLTDRSTDFGGTATSSDSI